MWGSKRGQGSPAKTVSPAGDLVVGVEAAFLPL